MYAIVEVGGKQYLVRKDDIIETERLETAEKAEFLLDKVLLVSTDDSISIGQPYVKGAVVSAIVLAHSKASKVVSFKYRRRKSSHWTKGHRQQLTRLKITDIQS